MPVFFEARTSPASMESVCPSGLMLRVLYPGERRPTRGHGLAPSLLPGLSLPLSCLGLSSVSTCDVHCEFGVLPCSLACGHLLVPAPFAGKTFLPPGHLSSLVEKPLTVRWRFLLVLFLGLFARPAPGPHRVDTGSFAAAQRSGSDVLAVGSRGVSHGFAGAGVSMSFSAKAPATVPVGTTPRVSVPPDAAPRSGRRAPSVCSGPLRFLPATTRRFPDRSGARSV